MEYILIFLSVLIVINLFERKLYRISRALVHFSFALLALSIVVYVKQYVDNAFISFLENAIEMSFIPTFYVFSEDFRGINWNFKRILVSIPIVFFLIFNTIWREVPLVENKFLMFWYLIYVIFVFFLSLNNLLRSKNAKTVKIHILIFFIGIFGYSFVTMFLNKSNKTIFLILLNAIFYLSQFLFIRKSLKSFMGKVKDMLFQNIHDGIIIVDENNYVLDVNKVALKILGKSYKTTINRLLDKKFENDDILNIDNTFYKVEKLNFEKGTIYFFRNVTKEIEYSKKYEISKKLFENLFKNLPDPTVLVTPTGLIVDSNKAFTELFGYKKYESIENTVPEYLKKESKILIREILKNGYTRYETVRKTKDGKDVNVRIYASKFEIEGQTFIYVIYSNISKEKQLLKQLSNLIEKDPLTNTFNKIFIIKKLKQLSSLHFHSLIFVDINNFQYLNSLKGNVFGDRILKLTANILKECLGEQYIISRAHTSEFWILAEELDENVEKAREKVLKLVNSIKRCLNNLEKEEIELEFSIGMYVFKSNEEIDEILRKATFSLSRAKEKNKIVFYSEELEKEFRNKIEKEIQIKKAIENGEFIPFFQPIVNKNGKVVGAEALIRWIKDGKVISPIHFLDYIERKGFIEEISEKILEDVCKLLEKTKKLQFVDINISPIQLKDKDFASNLLKIIDKNNVSSDRVTIEITENVFLEYDEIVKDNIDRLKRSGIRLCLDDFGTGYSSLSYLRDLPFDIIKIDKEFISNIDEEKNVNLLKAIYNIAKVFNMLAIPEGVENKKQLQILINIGFKIFQGYYFGKPMPEEEFLKLIN